MLENVRYFEVLVSPSCLGRTRLVSDGMRFLVLILTRNSACSNSKLLLEKHERLLLGVSRVSGWGVFAHSEIKRGSLIAEYRGELISHAEADRRGKIYDIVNKSYLFNLSDQQVMDGFRFGNKTRFSNNSKTRDNCEPMVMPSCQFHHCCA